MEGFADATQQSWLRGNDVMQSCFATYAAPQVEYETSSEEEDMVGTHASPFSRHSSSTLTLTSREFRRIRGPPSAPSSVSSCSGPCTTCICLRNTVFLPWPGWALRVWRSLFLARCVGASAKQAKSCICDQPRCRTLARHSCRVCP